MTDDEIARVFRRSQKVVFGRLIVAHLDGVFVAAMVVGDGSKITTLDHDAGAWYTDENAPTHRACVQCRNCSRFGHRIDVCYNRGVVADESLGKKRQDRRRMRWRPVAAHCQREGA